MGAGCGGGYNSSSMTGPGSPSITQLAPAHTAAGGPDFTLMVTGTGFSTGALVYWGGSTGATTYVSTTQVTALITAADIMTAGTVQVYVHSGNGNSNMMAFTIDP